MAVVLASLPALALVESADASKRVPWRAAHAPTPNTGKPGSPCAAANWPGDAGGDANADTTSLGPAAPAEYELSRPTSEPERSQPVKRVMMFIHGGSWFTVGRGAMHLMSKSAESWRAAGWDTVNITYHACEQSLKDVLTFYDLVRARFGAGVPICLAGESAGGHLALMVAAKRPDVSCVIARGAPTDLVHIAKQGAQEAGAGTSPPMLREGSAMVAGLARAAFGQRKLKRISPIGRASAIRARLLLGIAHDDALIPWAQAERFAGAVRAATGGSTYVDVTRLSPGGDKWTHAAVTSAAANDFDDRAQALVSPFGSAPEEDVLVPEPPQMLGGLMKFVEDLLGPR